MKDPDFVQRLRELSTAGSTRPNNNTARLREHIEEIEEALTCAGTSLQQVLDAFNHGQDDGAMPLASFKSALMRVRKERRGGKQGASRPSKGGSPLTDMPISVANDATPESEAPRFLSDLFPPPRGPGERSRANPPYPAMTGKKV